MDDNAAGPATAAAAAAAATVVDLDAVISHPYLEHRYPDRPRRLRDILRYEEETIQSFKQQFPDPTWRIATEKWEEGTPNAGRVRYLAIGHNSDVNIVETWDVPADVAVFDKIKSFLVLNNCRSFPDSISYLISLETINTILPHQDFTVPNDSMTTLTNVKELNFIVNLARNVGLLRQFFDLPSVEKFFFHCMWGDFQSEPERRVFMDNFLASISDSDIQACAFRNCVTEFPYFWGVDLSTDEWMNLHQAILRAFPTINRTADAQFELPLNHCKFVRIIEESKGENLANIVKTLRFTLVSALKVEGMERLIRLTRLLGENIHIEFSYWPRNPLLGLSAEEKKEMKGRQYKHLSRKFLTLLNGRDQNHVQRHGLDEQDKVPLSLWPSILERTNRSHQPFRTLKVPDAVPEGPRRKACVRLEPLESSDANEEEGKVMNIIPASAIYSLLRGGLVLQDSWRDQIVSSRAACLRSSATTSDAISTSSSATSFSNARPEKRQRHL